ncbi:MAG TPA: DNA mismatch repair endonuclease MutL [Pyrinomonadaceae bacterium]|nr:DNA mismatch repair endonuclease MutL [Pyrinomonadaceae bacterium]
MSKIHHLPDHVANQIAAGEVVERPASVAKELVENAIDAGASRIAVEIEGGGRRLLKVSDDGEGMVRDDAILAFERHATSKISTTDDLNRIMTLGFRGEALASIASVARVELLTSSDATQAGTRVIIDGGRMRDVKDAAHPRGSTVIVRDLFFNVPARRKFLRSEATESFHLTNLVTHYALAHPEIAFSLSNNGRDVLHAATANDLRERAYQIFGSAFLDNLLEVRGGHPAVARVSGYVSAPRDRRTSRDAQFLFVNGRFVRDRLIGRALSEGYRSILPHGVYPAVLLFLETPLEEVDVNVHPAKTEVRFRRAAAVADAVRESVRAALASAGYVRTDREGIPSSELLADDSVTKSAVMSAAAGDVSSWPASNLSNAGLHSGPGEAVSGPNRLQSQIDFAPLAPIEAAWEEAVVTQADIRVEPTNQPFATAERSNPPPVEEKAVSQLPESHLPPLPSAEKFATEATIESLSHNIRPLGQLEDSFIVALDEEGLLLIDQHVAHERILFDKYRALEATRPPESQQLLIPETFDLTPAQASVFELVAAELESYGFELMRLSGRTVAIKAIPADLPQTEARNILAEVLDTVDAENKGTAREVVRDEIAASLACHAAIKVNMALAPEKMRWLIDRLLTTSSPTTCPHGRPVILRLATRDILKGFHRS